MTVKPVEKPAVRRRFLTYDLEWYPETLELRVIGLFDGERYRSYSRPRDFLGEVLTPEYDGAWFYAHAGGLYDFQFLLDELVTAGWQVEAAFSGSSAIVVKVKQGKHSWFFIDSFWLLRESLAKIAKMVGMTKGDCAFDAPLPELLAYNELDCRILWRAIATFEDFLLDLGGELQRTIASSAMSLFKRAYLTRELGASKELNDIARAAYIGSRVEVFQYEASSGRDYDINSSFPAAMLEPQPCELIGSGRGKLPSNGRYLAEVTLTVPDCDLPPLPYRTADHRLFFPVGQWTAWLNDVDCQLAEETGCRIERVGRVKKFSTFDDLAGYASDIYERRRKASSAAEKYILKGFLNSLYGKFGERAEKDKLYINPPAAWLKKVDKSRLRMLSPGIFLYSEAIPIPHEHVAIAANITAIARRALYLPMRQCSEIYYCDTDGFCCGPEDTFPVSDELGKLKLVKELRAGIVRDSETSAEVEAPGFRAIAPKLYSMNGPEGLEIKAKGFSKIKRGGTKSSGMTYLEFCGLLEHKELPLESFARLRTVARSENLAPMRGETTKTWRGNMRPKRCRIEGTPNTRPWTVKELNHAND